MVIVSLIQTEPGLLSRLFFFIKSGKMNQLLNNEKIARKKSKIIPRLIIILGIIVFIVLLSILVFNFVIKNSEHKTSISDLQRHWNAYDYEAVYKLSNDILIENPFNNTALTYHGYSAFYLAVSQIDTAMSQSFLDEAINNMRNALLNAKHSLIPQLEYMLGKAYFYKNTITSYYYADLAVKYLVSARKHGYKADDIPEYLGLSYAALGQTMESISAFTEALLIRESDTLLLSIAEQYYKIQQPSAAKQYLFRIIQNSENDELIIKSRNLLANIYIDSQEYSDAKSEFELILQKNKNFADAYYGLGVIYEKQGDLVKARSEWRKALKLQVNHAGALAKISDYK